MRTEEEVVKRRLNKQHILQPVFKTPAEAVAYFGAVQAQEYEYAKWALGLRMVGATDAAIEQAFNNGEILRTHVMRPTWHFVAANDIRWLLELTAPRINAAYGYHNRMFGLDDKLFAKSNEVIIKALEGGKHLIRAELVSALQQAGIKSESLAYAHMITRAEADGIICSGPKRGKKFTYALLKERAPHAITLPYAEALAELTKRYFTSHGPATIQDFSWWSGLTVAEVKKGLNLAKNQLVKDTVNGQEYWFAASASPVAESAPTVHLLPYYDEYVVAYKDRRAILDEAYKIALGNGIFNPVVVVDGKLAGNWQRKIMKDSVDITVKLLYPLCEVHCQKLAEKVQEYAAFLELPAQFQIE